MNGAKEGWGEWGMVRRGDLPFAPSPHLPFHIHMIA